MSIIGFKDKEYSFLEYSSRTTLNRFTLHYSVFKRYLDLSLCVEEQSCNLKARLLNNATAISTTPVANSLHKQQTLSSRFLPRPFVVVAALLLFLFSSRFLPSQNNSGIVRLTSLKTDRASDYIWDRYNRLFTQGFSPPSAVDDDNKLNEGVLARERSVPLAVNCPTLSSSVDIGTTAINNR